MKKETALKLLGDVVKPIRKDLISWQDILAHYKRSYKKKDKNITISICQNKGGVGKTTSTINLGWLFSQIGKTLLIDLDPQANLSQVYNILIKDEPSLQQFIDTKNNNAIYNVSENLDIIPNKKDFEDWKKSLITKRNPSYRFRA
jgi:cellulose biosynthesis protein BcsQ